MKKKLALATVAAAAMVTGIVGTAGAMHDSSPAPVDDRAPSWSGHYSTPDVGQKGAARPWKAGPVWNR